MPELQEPVYIPDVGCGCAPEAEERGCVPETEAPACTAKAEECGCVPRIEECVDTPNADAPVYIPEAEQHAIAVEMKEQCCELETEERADIPVVENPVYIHETTECISGPGKEASTCVGVSGIDADFLRHMSRYIGATVTIYTAGGGEGGCGVTGVLVFCGDSYVRLLTQPATAPEKPQGMCRTCPFYAVCNARKATQKPKPASVGAMADIPVAQIVVFVHSAV